MLSWSQCPAPLTAVVNRERDQQGEVRDWVLVSTSPHRNVWERVWQLLSPTLEVAAVYYRQRFCLLTPAEYGRILLDVAEPLRAKLRERLRQIERDQYTLLDNPRPP